MSAPSVPSPVDVAELPRTLVVPLVDEQRQAVLKALQASKLTASELGQVLLLSGINAMQLAAARLRENHGEPRDVKSQQVLAIADATRAVSTWRSDVEW